METILAFAMGQANRNNPVMVFDWEKAARLIKERQPREARAGLRDDWEWTSGQIYFDGKPDTDSYTYLASTWAVPELMIDGEVIECFIMKADSPGWDSDTKWPDEALAILGETLDAVEKPTLQD